MADDDNERERLVEFRTVSAERGNLRRGLHSDYERFLNLYKNRDFSDVTAPDTVDALYAASYEACEKIPSEVRHEKEKNEEFLSSARGERNYLKEFFGFTNEKYYADKIMADYRQIEQDSKEICDKSVKMIDSVHTGFSERLGIDEKDVPAYIAKQLELSKNFQYSPTDLSKIVNQDDKIAALAAKNPMFKDAIDAYITGKPVDWIVRASGAVIDNDGVADGKVEFVKGGSYSAQGEGGVTSKPINPAVYVRAYMNNQISAEIDKESNKYRMAEEALNYIAKDGLLSGVDDGKLNSIISTKVKASLEGNLINQQVAGIGNNAEVMKVPPVAMANNVNNKTQFLS